MINKLVGMFFRTVLMAILLCSLTLLVSNMPASSATAPGIIMTIVGTGNPGYSGDGGHATSAELESPDDLAVDSYGNLYIAGNKRVRKVDKSGIINTIAGTGNLGYSGDGGPAASADIIPDGLAVDISGNLYISGGNRIRKVDKSGIITTIAGTGNPGYSGDGGPATSAELNSPDDLAVDSYGNLYIADTWNNCIRKIDQRNIITTVANTGHAAFSGSNQWIPAPWGMTADAFGNIYFTDSTRVYRVYPSGVPTTVAGNGNSGHSGDGGPAVSAELQNAQKLTVDNFGNLYVADANYIRRVDKNGIITTVAGKWSLAYSGESYSGDGGPATSADLDTIRSITVDAEGNLYIADGNRVRIVTAPIPSNPNEQKIIHFIVGNNQYSVSGSSFDMDTAPLILNGRSFVPVRFLANAMNAETVWDEATQKVTITKENTAVVLFIGSNNISTNGKTSQMDVSAVIINSRTYLPARYVAEAFGYTVSWDATSRAIIVSPQST